ncbi:MAG: PilZ domain-containing protein [Treponema sp.]|nr:PilZ domain-containing protein [Treponema sp.]
MAIATNQQITNYYDFYRDKEVIFSREILRTLRVDPRQIYIKCGGAQWPCIINSTSFLMAKIILGTKGGAFVQITQENPPPINLRFCFVEQGNQRLSFFILGKVAEVVPYMNSKELAIITLAYTQRPPDDFILKLGMLIEANVNFVQRREDRIIINAESKHKLAIEKEEAAIFVQNVPRKCILRDLSFSGAKVVLLGLPKFVIGKKIVLRLQFMDPYELIDVKGTVLAADFVEGRKDIVLANIKFDEGSVPIAYKIHINNYITMSKKKLLETSEQLQAAAMTSLEQAAENGATA